VEAEQDVLGSLLEIHVAPDHMNEPVGAEQCDSALQRLDEGHGPQTRAMRVAGYDPLFGGGSAGHRLIDALGTFCTMYIIKSPRYP
jgi:hypothetical protein